MEGPTYPDPIRTMGGARTTPEIDLFPYFNEYNRGKKSLTLDIKQAEGLDALRQLIRISDVFIEKLVVGSGGKEPPGVRRRCPDQFSDHLHLDAGIRSSRTRFDPHRVRPHH